MASTPHSGMSTSSSLPSPSQPSSSKVDLEDGVGGDAAGMLNTPLPPSPKKSQLDAIYCDNKVRMCDWILFVSASLLLLLLFKGKARSAHTILTSLNFPPLPGVTVSVLLVKLNMSSESMLYYLAVCMNVCLIIIGVDTVSPAV